MFRFRPSLRFVALAVFLLLCFGPRSYAYEYAAVATISKTVNNRVCVFNIDGDEADEIDCAAEAPFVDASGNVSATGLVGAPSFYLEGTAGSAGVSVTIPSSADNLGNHTAEQDLDMAGYDIAAAHNVSATGIVQITGETDVCSGVADKGTLRVDPVSGALQVCKP